MLRRRTRWFRRLAAGLAFATLAAPAAAKVDEGGGGNAAAATKVISYLSHGMTTSSAAQVVGNDDALTHRQMEELAASRAVGNGDAITHREITELSTQAIGNGDALTHRQMEELATLQATQFVPGVTDFPRAVAVEAPTVINYLSQGLTAADALDPLSGIPLSAGIPVAGAEVIPGDPSFGTFPEEPMSLATLGELVKSGRPEAVVRPDDQADRFAISSTDVTASASGTDSGLSWDGAMMVGIGTLVVVLALGLGFGYVRRPRLAGL